MKAYLSKFKTNERSVPNKKISLSLYSGLGGCIAIALLALLTNASAIPLIMVPFGASCVLAFGVPDSPLAQPRNIIGGHFISSLIGLVILHLIGNEWYALALGVGLAIFAMQVTNTTHPPAGADPLLIILAGSSWSYLLTPVLSGATLLAIIALIFNNLHKDRKYPKYWF